MSNQEKHEHTHKKEKKRKKRGGLSNQGGRDADFSVGKDGKEAAAPGLGRVAMPAHEGDGGEVHKVDG